MARQQGAQSQMAMAFETTYGVSPATGFTRMPFASTTLGGAQPLLPNELLGYGRDPIAPQRDAITVDGNLVVPLDPVLFGMWLKALLGQPESSTAGAFQTHVFTSGADALPSMAIEIQHPQVPAFAMNLGVRVNSINWTMQRSGLLTATLALMGQDEVIAAVSGAGDVEEVPLERFGHFNGSISRDGVALGNVVSTEITYTNNLEPVEVIREDGLVEGHDLGIAALTGRMTVRFDNTALLDQARNGETCALTFAYHRPDGASLTISVPAVHLPRAKAEVNGPAGVQVQFDWQAAQNGAGDPMMTVTLVNEEASY